MSPVARAMRMVIRFYQVFFSAHFGTQCRFTPTCSHYGMEAIAKYGAWRGGGLTLKRLSRCHPWLPGGFDPVP